MNIEETKKEVRKALNLTVEELDEIINNLIRMFNGLLDTDTALEIICKENNIW